MCNSFGVNTDSVKDGFPSHTSLNLRVNAEMGASYRMDCELSSSCQDLPKRKSGCLAWGVESHPASTPCEEFPPPS